MLLISLLGMAAMGGAAYAISDILVPADKGEDEDDRIEETVEDDLSQGNLLDADENVDEPCPPADFSQGDPPEDDFANESGADTGEILSEHEGHLVIAGDAGANVLTGQGGNDQINGYGGDDRIDGGAGNDVLHGGEGEDALFGNLGNDVLHGEYGDDRLEGMSGDDALYGHFGADVLDGGKGDDRLFGGQGDDRLSGGDGDDALQGGDGDDVLIGGDGKDVLFGGDGNDILSGMEGPAALARDFLNGGAGDDFILAGAGDVVTGGEGEDDIVLNSEPEQPEQEATTIMDFQVGQDKLLIAWDSPNEPDIAIEKDKDNNELTHVRINGEDVAQIYGAEGLTAEDIQFVTEAQLEQYAFTG